MQRLAHWKVALGCMVTLLCATALAQDQGASPSSKVTRSPERQEKPLFVTEEFVIEKARTQTEKDGSSYLIPEERIWFWTTSDAVGKAGAAAGMTFATESRLARPSPPATAKAVSRTNKSHDVEVRNIRGKYRYPDLYEDITSTSVSGKSFMVTLMLCPSPELVAALAANEADGDPCLTYCRKVVAAHDASLRRVCSSLITHPDARERMTAVLNELIGNASLSVWFRTAESTVSPVADIPLSGEPMLFAQLDPTMWLDVTCCGHGPVLLRISGRPDSMYDDACADAKALSTK